MFIKYPRTPHIEGSKLQGDDTCDGQVSLDEILDRNKRRPRTKQVPKQILDRMLWSWEPIDNTKIHGFMWS